MVGGQWAYGTNNTFQSLSLAINSIGWAMACGQLPGMSRRDSGRKSVPTLPETKNKQKVGSVTP